MEARALLDLLKSAVAIGLVSGAAQQVAYLLYKPLPAYDPVWLGLVANVLALSVAPMALGLTVGLVSRYVFAMHEGQHELDGSAPMSLAIAAFTIAAVISISL